jgi:hypothetical protein
MKKWLSLLVLGGVVTVGLSSQGAARPDSGPSDEEVNAHVDARLRQVMHTLLVTPPSDARTAALNR